MLADTTKTEASTMREADSPSQPDTAWPTPTWRAPIMPPDRRRPRPGANGRGLLKNNLVNSSNPEHRTQAADYQASARRRADFARGMMFSEFGYCAGRAIDYGEFVDRRPTTRWTPASTSTPTLRGGP